MFLITIMNSIYFGDIHNEGSENLSSSESERLLILNIVTCLLLFMAIILILYMYMVPSSSDMKSKELAKISDKKQLEYEEKLDEFKEVTDEVEKKKETRDQITKIVSSVESKRKVATEENNSLKKEVTKLSTELDDLKQHYGDLYDEHGNLIKTNEQLEIELSKHKSLLDEMDKNIKLKEKLEEARKNGKSVIMEGSSEIDSIENSINSFQTQHSSYTESLFGKDHKISVVPIPSLFPENASLEDILDEIPRSSIMTNGKEEQDYDYGIDIKSEDYSKTPEYRSFNFRRSDSPKIEENERPYFSTKPSVKESSHKSTPKAEYTPYYPSFMNQIFGK